ISLFAKASPIQWIFRGVFAHNKAPCEIHILSVTDSLGNPINPFDPLPLNHQGFQHNTESPLNLEEVRMNVMIPLKKGNDTPPQFHLTWQKDLGSFSGRVGKSFLNLYFRQLEPWTLDSLTRYDLRWWHHNHYDNFRCDALRRVSP
ncbi:MAG: hypothetical protein NZ480_04730, partial [Bdellovibrionaceae bacterium]|nr:hypothetical protein [Pseudobdellovibrionaceae bacterium]MDW8190782.1 hypothetical protein [Pseudobdellovibrionaceae bacterium]